VDDGADAELVKTVEHGNATTVRGVLIISQHS
jgi:hypothetical protein